MLGQIATFAFAPTFVFGPTFVFAIAGCFSAAVIGITLRDALPQWGRLLAERRALADDRVYLFTLIETPRHNGTAAPAVAIPVAAGGQVLAVPAGQAMINPVRRRAATAAVPLRAAA